MSVFPGLNWAKLKAQQSQEKMYKKSELSSTKGKNQHGLTTKDLVVQQKHRKNTTGKKQRQHQAATRNSAAAGAKEKVWEKQHGLPVSSELPAEQRSQKFGGGKRKKKKQQHVRKISAAGASESMLKPPAKASKKTLKRSNSDPYLTSRIQLELGRWIVLDRVVEAYDTLVSPVLGGASTGRAEQKRKRHLEAWLWARQFSPLLPLGELVPEAASAADGTLLRKLENAGLEQKRARGRVGQLQELLHMEADIVKGNVRVIVGDSNEQVVLACGGRTVKLFPTYFEKLRRLHIGKTNFEAAAFLMLARYRILQVHDKGGGNQGSVPEPVFLAIKRWAGQDVVEGFASPLNTLAGPGLFHSAFPDVDVPFGSRGSFFGASFSEGMVEVNPPFDEDIVRRVSSLCRKSLEEAAAANRKLIFFIVLPETDWSGHAEMQASTFRRWSCTLPAGEHFYQVGNQHTNVMGAYPASRNSTVLLLTSKPITGVAKLGKSVRAAFSARPM